ncbi:FAD-dependent oxidoreductase [Agrococcus sediminis]|uniref:FAD-dependent oxidoreductase n=1 Tax=Agrococcus sediminis TaxID=2599924 RepID=UPI003827D501
MSVTQERFDVVVVGSGAAGLMTAIRTANAGLTTLVLESSSQFGGTTALSGGRIWIPANGTPENEGDTPESARRYLSQIFDPRFPEFIDLLVDDAVRMRDFVEERTAHRFVVCPNYPDYHPHLEGATIGGRCFDMQVLQLDDLVAESSNVRMAPGYLPITHREWEAWRYPENMDMALLRERLANGGRTGGVALAAALVDGAVRAGAVLRPNTAVVGTLRDGDAVSGVVVDGAGGGAKVRARAVVLASGGFDGDSALRERLLPAGLSVSASAPSNTGIALRVAEQVGADVENLAGGWWMPMALVPGDEVDGRPYPRGLVRERGVPRSIIVNESGSRFIDEASPYNEFGKAMHFVDGDGGTPNRVAWLVFDEGFRERYPFPGLTAKGPLPAHVESAGTLEELAEQIGVDASGLVGTVAGWNRAVSVGIDDELGRGGNAYDRYYGDPWAGDHPNFGPIDRAPFYATRIYSGSIGSKGGPVTDVDGRVLRGEEPVDGLYAVGNAAAFWTGDGYPGPGATLAVGMVMGLRAGDAIERSLAPRR